MDKITGKISNTQSISGKVDNRQSVSGQIGLLGNSVQDYNMLINKPSIEDVTLIGNKTMSDFGERKITNFEIQDIIDSVFN